tara:strand:- start:112 stop:606 length:495 start_codon:yes stop_codon:yes gene_type:complete
MFDERTNRTMVSAFISVPVGVAVAAAVNVGITLGVSLALEGSYEAREINWYLALIDHITAAVLYASLLLSTMFIKSVLLMSILGLTLSTTIIMATIASFDAQDWPLWLAILLLVLELGMAVNGILLFVSGVAASSRYNVGVQREKRSYEELPVLGSDTRQSLDE